MDRETGRQLFHIFIGLCAIIFIFHFGRGTTMAAIFFTIIIGMVLINIRLQGNDIPIISWFEEKFERIDAPLPGWGSACYAVGVLLAITFLPNINQIAATILVLALGDGVSTIVGVHGRIKLPYNNKKTLEGTLAMFISSLMAYIFIGPLAIGLALVAALAESVPYIEDNLWIPIICTAFLVIF